MRARIHFFSGVLSVAFAWTWVSVASACPCYPAELDKLANVPSNLTPPPCTVCHATEAGGTPASITKTFGMFILANGADGYSLSSLDAAWQADLTAKHVSNDAGVTDLEALQAGEDPNDPLPPGTAPPAGPLPPTYGCGAQIASATGPTATTGFAALVVLLGAGVARTARRRRT